MPQLPLLIVEDDRDLRDALCITLELAGYTLIAAADGCEALAIMEHERVGLVVSDHQMQPMDGFSLLREIRRNHARVPVILMTAFADIENAVAAMHAGAADYLAKPFEPERLLQLVERYHLRAPEPSKTVTPSASLDMKSVERKHIMDTLRAVNGSRKLAIERLGISERTLRYKLQRYRLEMPN
jgi:two-component system response regulator FlrC